ncbi:MAG: GIY-YIG nuclease family protein [Christensenellales bacterium]
MNNYYVYILSNKSNKVLYIGVTNDLQRRVYEHKNKLIEGFTSKYNIDKLLHYEITTDIKSAIEREKQLKSWRRAKKEELINNSNPQRKDLSIGWFEK